MLVAVRGGFEPPVQFPARQFSKLLVSATHPPHQWGSKDIQYLVYANVSLLFFRCRLGNLLAHIGISLDVTHFVVIHNA